MLPLARVVGQRVGHTTLVREKIWWEHALGHSQDVLRYTQTICDYLFGPTLISIDALSTDPPYRYWEDSSS